MCLFVEKKQKQHNMSKGITKGDNYVFTLSDDSKQLAEKELRETNASRTFALNALREWIESNQRLAAVRLGKLQKIYISIFQITKDSKVIISTII